MSSSTTQGTRTSNPADRPGPFWLAILSLLLGLAASPDARAQAVLNPNQIAGVIELTNRNPEILSLLQAQGFINARVRATSIGGISPLNHLASPSADSPTSISYELTVEASEQGIPYLMNVSARLDSGKESYFFSSVEAPSVQSEPAPDVVMDVRECAGLLDVEWVDANGDPFPVQGGGINVYDQPNEGRSILKASNSRIPQGAHQEYLAVRGDGSDYRVDAVYETGSDPYFDTVRAICRETVTARCDEITKVTCVAALPEELGEISGRIDMLGEEEQRIGAMTKMRAFDGPRRNTRFDTLQTTPSSGSFLLRNLVPSSAHSPPRGYGIYAEMVLRTGYRTQYLRTPRLYGAYNGGHVSVEAGQATDLGDTFVMLPGYVSGRIFLAGPPRQQERSILEAVWRDADRDDNGDGIPDDYTIPNSYVGAMGTTSTAAGATSTTFGAMARASFEGAYAPDLDGFEGNYELVLGGLHGEASIWRPNLLVLRFLATSTPEQPEHYQDSVVQIRNYGIPMQEIRPGEALELDHAYCMSRVELSYRSLAGSFYDPRARAQGTLRETDFLGNAADQLIWATSAHGTPLSSASASDRGLLIMALPQGSYRLTPAVTAVNPTGGTSNTELPSMSVDVGCRQVISLMTDLQVSLDGLPQCTDEPTALLSGQVNSDGAVSRLAYSNNGGSDVQICSACGEDPSFAQEVSLDECRNEITVTAVDELGNEASVTAFVEDNAPPALSGCEDVVVEAEPGSAGAFVELGVSAADACKADLELRCDVPSGSFFEAGETLVSCTAVDPCGNEARCSFTVSVLGGDPEPEDADADDAGESCESDTLAPVVECSMATPLLWPPNHKLVDVGLGIDASDRCSEGEDVASGGELKLTSAVWSDETELSESGDGSGMHAPDAKQRGNALLLRRERRGTEDGRVYLAITRAEDASGNVGVACCTVVVPHDKSKRSIRSVNEQADAARTYCEESGGAPPAGFTRHGVSAAIGPKQHPKGRKNRGHPRSRRS